MLSLKQFKREYWHILCLGVSYFLCRFALFGLHQMKAWPNLLALVGFALLLISSGFKLKWMSAGSAVGYMMGFVVGAVFNTNGVDAGGGRTNDFWIIWTAAYFLVVVAGFVMDKILRPKSAEK